MRRNKYPKPSELIREGSTREDEQHVKELTSSLPTVRIEPVVEEYRCSNESCKASLNPGKDGRLCGDCR